MSLELILASCIVALLVILLPTLFLLSKKLGPSNVGNKAKNSVYESGISSPVGSSESRFSAKFYLVAILFVLFDVEVIFMYPWAVNFKKLGWFGFSEMVVFLTLLMAGFYYVIRKGVLNWERD